MIETWEKILDPNFINADLIGPAGSERTVTIKDIDFKEAYDNKTNTKAMKQSLFLEECKPMILNKTNRKTLIKLFGAEDPRACVGKKIVLYVIDTKVGGKATTGIRIKEYTEEKCEVCGNPIKPAAGKTVAQLIEIAKRNTGRQLCLNCMKKAKENMTKEEDKADEDIKN